MILSRSLPLKGTPKTVMTACTAGPEDVGIQPGHPQEASALMISSRGEEMTAEAQSHISGCNKEDSTTGKGIVSVDS